MNGIIAILVMIAFVVMPAASQAMGNKAPSRAQDRQNDQSFENAQNSPGGSSTVVRGTAIIVDPQTQIITIADYITGGNRTFAAGKNELNGIQTGDKVTITPEHDDPNKAQKVEKQEDRP